MIRSFTPGPWEVDSGMVQTAYNHKDCKLSVDCGVHVPIAYMDRKTGNGTVPCERDANAYLIAATPELLEVAQLIVGYFEESGQNVRTFHGKKGQAILDKARQAIKKARKDYW